MRTSRRDLMAMGGMAALAGLIPVPGWAAQEAADLKPITGDAAPISPAERKARIVRARELMRAQGFAALLVESGSSLDYFTGIRWGRSERLTAAVIPVEGDILVVTPGFEEPSIRERLQVGGEVRVWQEDESPFALIAGWLRERRLQAGKIGVEETVRFFAVDGLRRAAGETRVVDGSAIARGCRMIKTPAEIALMQVASDVQIAAFRHVYPRIRPGMSQDDLAAMMAAAQAALGGESVWQLILIGESSAYPHGSDKPQRVGPGTVILFDCGVGVHGYQSDISRTMVFGAASTRQRAVFEHMRKGQEIAFAAARIGAEAGSVDDAVRRYYESLGYGPGYKLPGTSHRTGHGIGMDGHEPINLVHGETAKLAPGMCFSNEPGIYLPGAFGIRLEDCFHMTPEGPRYFSQPVKSLDAPFG